MSEENQQHELLYEDSVRQVNRVPHEKVIIEKVNWFEKCIRRIARNKMMNTLLLLFRDYRCSKCGHRLESAPYDAFSKEIRKKAAEEKVSYLLDNCYRCSNPACLNRLEGKGSLIM